MDKTVPLGRVKGTLTPPCSKSYAQRALAASLLCGETSVLRNLEFCDDTRSALRCIETLGARVKHVDASTLSIEGGLHPRGKVLHVGESGLATRLFTPIASLCGMPVTIEGEGTLLRRPMHMMIEPLRRLGVRVRDNDGYLPFEVRGPIRGGEIDVDGAVSSQFITGLLLALPLSQHDTTLHVRSAVSTPYLDMTVDTAARFGVEICHNDYKEFYIEGGQRYRPAFFSIEGDWSAAAMLLVAGAVAGEVTVKNVSMLSKQADTAICTALVRAGARPSRSPRTGPCAPSNSTPRTAPTFSRHSRRSRQRPRARASSAAPRGSNTRSATVRTPSAKSTPRRASRWTPPRRTSCASAAAGSARPACRATATTAWPCRWPSQGCSATGK